MKVLKTIKVFSIVQLLLLPLLLNLVSSCKNQVKKEETTIIEKKDTIIEAQPEASSTKQLVKKEATKKCLDTLSLNKLGIKYQQLDASYLPTRWLLSFEDTIRIDENIPLLRYHYSIDKECNGLLGSMDSFFVIKNDQQHKLIPHMYYIHSIRAVKKPDIQFEDYNFDGQLDISVFSSASGATGNTLRTYFLYNKRQQQFIYSEPFSRTLVSTSFEAGKKEIYCTWTGGHSGMIGGNAIYKCVEGDSLKLIKKINRHYVDSLNAYLKVEKIYDQSGKVKTIVDTLAGK